MADSSLCRIGVFYDGSYFSYAQRYFFHERQIGWLDFRRLHALIETFVWSKEQGFSHYKVVYAAWFQGLHRPSKADEQHLKSDRRLYYDLMYAGIEAKYLPVSDAGTEKGVDVALAIDAMQVGTDGEIDIAVLVAADGDFVPLARALMKHGIRVMTAYFEYEQKDGYKAYASDYLLNTCNYVLNINQLESDKDYKASFRGLFRKADEVW